jgi:hypothetical protein
MEGVALMTCKGCPSKGKIVCSQAVRIPNFKGNKTGRRLKCMGVIGPVSFFDHHAKQEVC